jgi:ribosomal protein S21
MKKSNVVVKRKEVEKKSRGRRRESDSEVNEKMIKRFNRKCKRERIVNEFKEKSMFISKKEKRKKKRARAIQRINKLLKARR